MNDAIASLATQNFYARPSDLRSFLSSAIEATKEKSFFDGEFEKVSIAQYGAETTTINITGLMLRERSIFTDLGWAVSTEEVIDEIKQALSEDKKIRLVMNTGGGLVSGTSNLADIIFQNRDRIEAYATGVVASAGMWVFSAAGKRYAESTTVMGSIGVVTSVFDDEQYWSNYGIVWKEVVSENAKNKRPDVKTESGQNEVRRYLTSLETIFIDSVSKALDMSNDEIISNFHQGGLITGQDAFDLSVVSALTSYDMVATMPSKLQADVKIANSNIEDCVMNITQEQLDAVKSQLDNANASIKTLEGEIGIVSGKLETAESDLGAANATIETLQAELASEKVVASDKPEIIAMAFEHGVTKETALEMYGCANKGDAAVIALNAKGTVGSTSAQGDLPDAQADEDEKETAAAIEIARKNSVRK